MWLYGLLKNWYSPRPTASYVINRGKNVRFFKTKPSFEVLYHNLTKSESENMSKTAPNVIDKNSLFLLLRKNKNFIIRYWLCFKVVSNRFRKFLVKQNKINDFEENKQHSVTLDWFII